MVCPENIRMYELFCISGCEALEAFFVPGNPEEVYIKGERRMDGRIQRITEMEGRLNRIRAWLKDETSESVEDDARTLDAYYRSPLWRSDFEADEAGELPPDLPRGVLSEDAVYTALTDYEDRTMSKYHIYDKKIVRIRDTGGKLFTGVAWTLPTGCCLHEYDHEEEGIQIGMYVLFESDIESIEILPDMEIIRATEIWQQAGAFYVRIQAMAKKHHITLRQEFDEHDGPDTKYIVVTDAGFPIATARMYPLDSKRMMIGRVVVLPEYRHQGIGTMVVNACEEWAEELNYAKTVVESRDNKVAFYEQMCYEICGEAEDGETFRCVRMEKDLYN